MMTTIRNILVKHGGLPVAVDQLADDADLYAAGLSSFASVQIMLAIEEAFDIEFPDNLLNRDFSAGAPNEKWLTDITEFQIPAGKVYLSPMIDCFDGMVVSWSIGTRPTSSSAPRSPAGWDSGSPTRRTTGRRSRSTPPRRRSATRAPGARSPGATCAVRRDSP